MSAPKREDAQFHIALIGALPKRKGLARAVELIKLLRRHDSRYVLHVPGKAAGGIRQYVERSLRNALIMSASISRSRRNTWRMRSSSTDGWMCLLS